MRKVLELPRNFQELEIEFQKKIKQFWFQAREKAGKEGEAFTDENEAILYLMLEKFENMITNEKLSCGQRMLNKHEGNEFKILLPQYGKMVIYDKEANWIIPLDMEEQDWYEEAMRSNFQERSKK